MHLIKKILVPINLDNAVPVVLNHVVNFYKKDTSISIHFLNVTKKKLNEQEQAKAEAKVNEIESAYGPHITKAFTWSFEYGESILDTILNVQKQKQPDLIIMGTRGGKEDDDYTLASKLVLAADCPVLAIPEKTKRKSIKKIALSVGTDLIHDPSILGVLFAVARMFDAEVHVLTVQRDDVKDKQIQQRNDDLLGYYFEGLFARHAFSESVDIEKGIFDYVKNFSIDLLAIMPRNHAKEPQRTEGKLTKILTLHTEVPLLALD